LPAAPTSPPPDWLPVLVLLPLVPEESPLVLELPPVPALVPLPLVPEELPLPTAELPPALAWVLEPLG
jgi:hypothetical protein